jgi:MFS transporter, DHA2 family, methylenomycin A resistance protein
VASATGMGLFGAGLWMLATVSSTTSYFTMALALLIMGVGNGLIFGPIITLAVSNVGEERSGMSSGLVNVARMVGATLGVAIPGSIFGAHVAGAGQDIGKFLTGMHKAFFIAGMDEVAGGVVALGFLGLAIKQAGKTADGQEQNRRAA